VLVLAAVVNVSIVTVIVSVIKIASASARTAKAVVKMSSLAAQQRR